MERTAKNDLLNWLKSSSRQPLVLRGARQVGKTWLVRDLAKSCDKDLIEINFERDPSYAECFGENDPLEILGRIGLRIRRKIEPSTCILFLDEIQEFGEGLAKLRWFSEELPELPVIAAGSLLELTLKDHHFSMPVGRIAFYNLYPVSFSEYLEARERQDLLGYLDAWQPGQGDLDPVAHKEAGIEFERFSMVGGMPGIVEKAIKDASSEEIRNSQRQLCATYRSDFPKYSGRMSADILDKVLISVVRQLGQKFVMSKVGDGLKHYQVRDALDLFSKSRVCRKVCYSASNGIPLQAGVKEKFKKIGLLDAGLLHALADTPATPVFPQINDLDQTIRAKLAEQLTIQQLCLFGSKHGDPQSLYYWQRDGGRPGEIDHILQHRGIIIPLELKSGAAGSMKSLHQFMYDKGLTTAVRIDSNPPSLMNVDVKTTQGNKVSYRLLGIPLYLLYRLEQLLAETLNS